MSDNIIQQFTVDSKLHYRLRLLKKEIKTRADSEPSENKDEKHDKDKSKIHFKPKRFNSTSKV